MEKGLANMEHAFVATYGNGAPVIGILAEFDALGNLSQVADCEVPNPLIPGGHGHGCGHNLLGAGALAGAVGMKDYMKQHNLQGTIQLFGCPAEESGYGKAFMARDGIFHHLDIALTWHPMDITNAWGDSSLAVFQAYFNFKGRAAHAAAAPEQGCSALDAAELMNIGVQFLREHIVDSARIHYAFIDAGGESANVVQPTASLYYFVRAKSLDTAREIFSRVEDIANGAALMTGTKVEMVFDSAAANYIPNHALTEVLYENMKEFADLNLTEADLTYGDRYVSGLSEDVKKKLKTRVCNAFPAYSEEEKESLTRRSYWSGVLPLAFSDHTAGSTDVGDVSWVVPTAQFMLACEPQGTPPHSWQWTANGKSDVAHKGVLAAGKVIAATALDILENPSCSRRLRKSIRKHFKISHIKVEYLKMYCHAK